MKTTDFSVKFSDTGLSNSIVTLMEEIRPVVEQKNEFGEEDE